MKTIYSILFLLLFLLSCSQQTQNNKEKVRTYNISLENISTSNFFTNVDTAYFVVLETNNNSLIGEIGQLSISNKLILTDRQTNSIMQFDLKGNHISTNTKVGNGPGEYIRIDGLCIYEPKDYIMILDAMKNKVIVYDSNFNFIEERNTSVPFGPTAFSIFDYNTLVFEQSINSTQSDKKYNLFVNNKNGETTYLLPFNKTANTVFSPRITLYYTNDTLVYVPTYNNIVYNIFNNKIEPRLKFDFGDKWIKEDIVYNSSLGENPLKFIETLKDQDFVYFFNELENSTHIYIDFYYKNDSYISIINKKDNKNTLIRLNKNNDFSIKPLSIYKDYFIIPVTTSESTKIINNNYKFKGKNKMFELNNKLQEENNPILMFVKFK